MKQYKITIELEGIAPNEEKVLSYLNTVKALIAGVNVYPCKFKIVSTNVEEVDVDEQL